jgi:lipid-binding SYLF domain-containing protein
LLLWIALLITGCLFTTTAVAKPYPNQQVEDATEILQQFVKIPEHSIPPDLLRHAHGIAIFPGVLKFGFIFGYARGHGIVSIRKQDGKWSKPAFVTLSSASLGLQAGGSSTDIILVFKTRRSVDKLAHGQFNLGGDASVAAGPVGRHVGASTIGRMGAEIYSYSRSRGLFAGVSVNGGRIGIDKDSNWLYYSKAGVTPVDILHHGESLKMPESGKKYVYTLNQYLPPSNNGQSGSNSEESGNSSVNSESSSGHTSARKHGGGVSVQSQSSSSSK